MSQIEYTMQLGDTLPSIAEACGHSGEWRAIVESAPWLDGLDYLQVPAGSTVLLPEDWTPPGYEPPPARQDRTQAEETAAAVEHVEEHGRRRTRDD